ncbi:MAG: 4Fe-4S binding protein, partial [Eggerthellaceae bacterium]|nr:4Fe-4S binding protein [Eggerthellaceae bacterium]
RAFGFGDPSWALIIIPVVLILELVVFRKWCHWICPVSALMSLVAKGNKTVRPTVDVEKCLETKGVACSSCAHVCPEGINLHDPESVKANMNECTRCHACVDVCPTGALSIKFLAGKASAKAEEEAQAAK